MDICLEDKRTCNDTSSYKELLDEMSKSKDLLKLSSNLNLFINNEHKTLTKKAKIALTNFLSSMFNASKPSESKGEKQKEDKSTQVKKIKEETNWMR